ncbi:hypothetical protein BH11ARM2_BH11ARM2_38240 [soil metagenome]
MLRVLIPLALLAFQAPTVALAPVQGSKVLHTMSIKMDVGGRNVTVSSDHETTYTMVGEADFTAEQTTSNLKVMVDENEFPAPATTLKVQMGKDGSVKSIEGGMQGADAIYNHLLFRFVPTPAETDKTTTVEFKGDSGKGFPDQKVESTYIGPKKSGDMDGYEFKQKTTAGDMTSTTDFVVKADGTILEATSTFSGLPIPAANGLGATGTATLKMKTS